MAGGPGRVGPGGVDPGAVERLVGSLSHPRGAALVAAALAALVYANSLSNGFAYDDVHILLENEAVQSLRTLPGALVRPYWPGEQGGDLGLWRPVTTAAYGLQYALWGGAAVGFHLVNVLLHAGATLLTVLLLTHFVPVPAAFVGGLLFAVHPVHVEAVANVVGLGELLPAVLYLGACLLTVRGGQDGSPGRTAAVAGLFALAFLAKESAVTLPAAVFLLDAARHRLAPGDLPAYARRRAPLYGSLVLVAAVLLLARYRILGSVASPDPALGAHLLREIPRIWTLGVVWAEYVRLFFFPARLFADYAPDVVPILTVWTPRAVAGVVAVLAALGAALLSWRRGVLGGPAGHARILGFGVAWFLVTISPVSNVLFMSGILVAERTLYLPSVGVLGGLGWALWRLTRWRRAAGWAVVAMLLLPLGARTWTRTPVWATTATVFADMIEEQPSSGRAQWVLGDILQSRGRLPEANAAYRRAIGLLDSSYRLLMEVGWDAVERGDVRLGGFLLLRGAEDVPDHPLAHRRLALLSARRDRPGDVVVHGRRAVELVPGDVVTWHLLAGALTELGRWEEAAHARERVIALGEGEHWQQWLSLANLRLTLGDSLAAREALAAAVERAPTEAARQGVLDGFQALSARDPESGGAL